MKIFKLSLALLFLGIISSCEKPLFKAKSETFDAVNHLEVNTEVLSTNTSDIDAIWVKMYYEDKDYKYTLSVRTAETIRNEQGYLHEDGQQITFVPSTGSQYYGELSDCRQKLKVYQSPMDRSKDLVFQNKKTH